MMTNEEREKLFETAATVKLINEKMNKFDGLKEDVTRNTERINIQRWLTGGIYLLMVGAVINSFFH